MPVTEVPSKRPGMPGRPAALFAAVAVLAAACLASCNGSHSPGLTEPDSAVSTLGKPAPSADGPPAGGDGKAGQGSDPAGGKTPEGPDEPGKQGGDSTPAPGESGKGGMDENQYIQQNRLFLEIMSTAENLKPDEVLDAYRKRAGDKPEDAVERFLYGWSLFIFGKSEEALQQLDKAKSLRRGLFWADFGLAVLHTKLKNEEKASFAMKDLREKAEGDVWRSLLAGEILISTDKDAGEKYFEEVRRRFPESSEPLKALARYYMNQKDYERTLKLLDKALERSPEDPLVSFYKGLVFLKRTEEDRGNPAAMRQSLGIAEQHFGECLGKLDKSADLVKVVKVFLEMIELNVSPWVKLTSLACDPSKPEEVRIKAAKTMEQIGQAAPLKYWIMLADVEDRNPHVRIAGIRGLAFFPEPAALDKLIAVLGGDPTGHDCSNAAFSISEIEKQKPGFRTDKAYGPALFKALFSALSLCASKGWTYKFEEVNSALNSHTGKQIPASGPTPARMGEILAEWLETGVKEYGMERLAGGGGGKEK